MIARAPDSVRAPDVAFVRAERVRELLGAGFGRGAPDPAVEVLSPSDRSTEVAAKVADWLRAGTRRVWVGDPAGRTVTVHTPDRPPVTITENATVADEELLPGFVLPVATIFEDLPDPA